MDFSHINKQQSRSFNNQKVILKALSQGKSVYCDSCKQPLQLNLATGQEKKGSVICQKGCTYIELELA
jgi:hypothetical protein